LRILATLTGGEAMEQKPAGQLPERMSGRHLGAGIGIGLAVGAGVGVALGNIAIGVGVGLASGVAVAAALWQQGQGKPGGS
jgi:hypothetical protein